MSTKCTIWLYNSPLQGRIQDFKLGGAHLKKLCRAEGGAKIVGVFRVKNHDFTPKNHIFFNFRGGGGMPGAPPGSAPALYRKLQILRLVYSDNLSNKVWSYQMGNQKLYIEGQTTQWPKEKGQIMIYKTLH
jgi:hypothetical protein